MAEISITTKLEELKVLFNQMKEVYYVSKVNSDLATLAAFDMELPVLSDGVTFDTGAADVSKIKLTTGALGLPLLMPEIPIFSFKYLPWQEKSMTCY